MSDYAWFDCGDGRKVFRRVSDRVVQRSHLPAPRIRPDGMDATWNPVDGNRYESRSQYERAVKAAGCEIVGNDEGHWNKRPDMKPEGVRQDVVNAWKQHTE